MDVAPLLGGLKLGKENMPETNQIGAVGKNVDGVGENPYTIAKSNPTDVTKMSNKDLQYFAEKGHTSITDRYGNTRQLTPTTSPNAGKLNDLNPTGGLFVDYTPKTRATMPLGSDMTTLDKTSSKAPNDIVTVYRGAPSHQTKIAPGDYITTNKDLAKSYTDNGNVIETKVPASHILDSKTSPLGEEYIYRPNSAPPIGVGKNVGEPKPIKITPPPKIAITPSVVPSRINLTGQALSTPDRLQITQTERQLDKESAGAPKPLNADLDRQAQNILKNGGTPDEAANVYVEGQNADRATAFRNVSRVAQQSGISLGEDITKNPYYNKILLPEAKTDEQSILNRQAIQKNIADKVNQVDLAAKDLSPKDVGLLDRLRNEAPEAVAKRADNPNLFKEVATKSKDATDYQQELGRMHGQDVGYRPSYGARLSFDISTPERQQAVEAYKAMLKNTPGYGKRRAYRDYETAAKESNGLLVRRNKSFLEDLRHDAQARANDIGQLGLAKGLKTAHPGLVKEGEIGTDETGTYKQLKIAGGKKLTLPSDIADELNHRSAYEYRQGPVGTGLKFFDNAINAPLKFFKLALGGFHDLNTYLGFVANQVSHGKVGGLVKAISVQAGHERFNQAMETFRGDAKLNKSNASTLEWANTTGLTHGIHEISADVGGPLIEKIPLIKQAHSAMFEREIPYMKLKTLQSYTEGRDITNPADVEYVREAAKATNYAYGGLNRAVEGFTPTGAKHWGRGLLALDFNEGQVRSLINAVIKGGPGGDVARRVVAGRMALIAAPGTVAWAVQNPDEAKKPGDWLKTIADQLVDPHVPSSFKTPGGIPKNIKLITNDAGKLFRIVQPAFDKNNPDKTIGLKHEAAANTSAGVSELLQLKNNQDYYGNPIFIKNKNGGVNIAKTAGQIGLTAAPIPANQVARVVQGKETPAEAAINITGVGHTAANPDDPRLKILNSRGKVYQSLSPDNKAAVDLVHPGWNQNLTPDQKTAIYQNPAYESNKWNVLAHNQDAVTALRKQDMVAQQNGQPGDPLFKLSPQDYKTVTTYQWLKNSDPGTDANNSAAVMYNEHTDLIKNYENDVHNYGQQMTQAYQQSSGLQGSTDSNFQVGAVPHFTVTPQIQSSVNDYSNLTDSKSRVDYLAQHPEVSQYFDAQFKYENQVRASLNEPLLKPFPKASSEVQGILDTYSALPASKSGGNTDPSTSGMRSAWIKANPGEYAKMNIYYAQYDAYILSKQAGQVQFQGQDYNQKSLKAIQSLGQYDIMKNPDGTLALLGTSGVQAGAVSTGSGSGSGSGYSKSKKIPFFIKKRVTKIRPHYAKKAHKVFLNKGKPVRIASKSAGKHSAVKIKSGGKSIKLVQAKAPIKIASKTGVTFS